MTSDEWRDCGKKRKTLGAEMGERVYPRCDGKCAEALDGKGFAAVPGWPERARGAGICVRRRSGKTGLKTRHYTEAKKS